MKHYKTGRITIFLFAALLTSSQHMRPAYGDWPTYRGDARRSGVSSEHVVVPLVERWRHKAAHAPQPAWPEMSASRDVFRQVELGPTVVFDRAFHVTVCGQSLFFGSSVDDHVYCLDASSGKVRWSFCTEGPVRLAPTISQQRVYVGSDDGCVYCLAAADGHLLWRHRIGPADRRLPGNGRMISLWPVRCGVVVEDDTVYVCAGLFPSQGAYLCAMRAEDGEELWRQKVDISAQGYLVASSKRLFVPTGRTPPHIYERHDGSQVAAYPGTGQQRSGTPEGGGSFAVLVDEQLFHGGGEKGGIQVTDASSREKIVWSAGLRVVASGPLVYILGQDRLTALDRDPYFELLRLQQKKKKTAADEKRTAEVTADKRSWLKWEVPCQNPYELILAGKTVFVGSEDHVVAYDSAEGKQMWTGDVDGKAYSLAVSDGRLFVGTDKGTIHCFEAGNSGPRDTQLYAGMSDYLRSPYPDDHTPQRYRLAAEAAVNAAGSKKGYCLVLGADTVTLAYEMSKRSAFRIIGIEPDADKVAPARELLVNARVYGSRIVIHQGKLDQLPYQKRFANLVVSEEALANGTLPPSASEVHRILRPSGGVAVFTSPSNAADAAKATEWGEGALPGWKVVEAAGGGWTGTARRGPLAGAGEWTHFYADAGNTACSGDALRPGPVDIQWFGRPGPRRMVDRHEKNVGPLYKDGRLFISGDDYVAAVDAYNGTVLWEQDLPNSIRLGAFKNSGSMAVADDYLYVASADGCMIFNVKTGQKSVFALPDEASGNRKEWGYLATVGDFLFGSVTKPDATFRIQDIDTQVLMWRDNKPVVCSDALFALNRRTGKTLWSYSPPQGVIVNPTIAVGGGRIYCVESTNPETREVSNGRANLEMLLGKGSAMVALDISNGEILWRKPVDFHEIQHILFLSYAKETLVVTGTKNVSVQGEMRVRYDLYGFDAASGEMLWQTTQKPVPDHILEGPHGEQVQHSAIVGETIYNTGFALQLRSGQPIDGWKWQKSDKCGVLSTSAFCGFSRFSNPRMFDLKTGNPTALTSVTRPGCWVNMIPAGGLVLIPEASSGCTCYYSIQTSLALTPRDGNP